MYVKTVTLKGFKSFASATTLRLEPGITCIVGPNGSGKSNVVDALAWVMGEQGAKTLRGGRMEDVIFAGTAGRAPLGRAEVSLTIDNADGALPIDYTEVTLTRTMFRNGGSDYAINGTPSRLLDIQELLSDSGIGREMHVIVGQGQLDAVLRATPQERRGFIEEAAGVLKHRKRKERALRKLESMQTNLTRVADLTAEIRRQLGPLGRQAQAARRAAVIQAEARDARLRLLADDLVQLTSVVAQEAADESALLARRAALDNALTEVRAELVGLEEQAAAAAPELSRAHERWGRLQSLRDRLAATGSLAEERLRLLARDDADEATTGRDPQELRTQAAQARQKEAALAAEVATATAELAAAVTVREHAEKAYAAEAADLARLVRAAADRREGLARLTGQIAARRSRVEAGEAELGRLRTTIASALSRATSAEREFAALEGTVADDEAGELGLDLTYEKGEAELARARGRVEDLLAAQRAVDTERASARARVDALELSVRRKDGAAALLEAAGETALEDEHGILGSVAALLQVRGGHEAAIAAALGSAAEALGVRSTHEAAAALTRLRDGDHGRATLLVAETAPALDRSLWPDLPGFATWAVDVVQTASPVAAAVAHLLDRVAVVKTAEQALALVADGTRGVSAVTLDGDVFGPGWACGGSPTGQSLIELEATLEQARAALGEATARGQQLGFELAAATQEADRIASATDAALEALHESDARLSAVAESLGSLGSAARAARAEAKRAERALADVDAALAGDRAELAELLARLEAAQREPVGTQEPSADERDRLELDASKARTRETELRLTLRTTEERASAVQGRAEALEGAARAELAARERLKQRRERRRREAALAQSVSSAAAYAVQCIGEALHRAVVDRDAGEADRTQRELRVAALRAQMSVHQDELRELTDTAHRDEVARARQLARIEQLQSRAIDELGVDPEVLVEDFGPHQLIPVAVGPDQDGEPPEPAAFVREEQEKRLRRAERALSQLGRVNPLALEEYAALEERHTFLTEQLEDLKRSKRDLLDIVREVDERVEQVFTEAFADTATQFERVFERLFPGGAGRLVLTDPSDMLATGIEVEARPPGKKVKRLSLLSGGERSLVAVALLVAIFKARPSPFYIMDEVEAALDDTNLGRLLILLEELRDSSQLIVITHQKKTMEIADALYGVSMRGDGITTVVSQRLRESVATA